MRFGTLHSVRRELVVGDPGRKHLALLPDEVHYRIDREVEAVFPWPEVTGIRLSFPTTRFRFPAAVSGVTLSALALLMNDDPQISPKDGVVVVSGSDDFEAPLSCHHLGGYWQRSVDVAQNLISRFVDDPSSRVLLSHPDSLVEAAASAARRRPR
ncbi:hypothetical protein AB3M89_04050 [Microbacterium sp. 179-I 3D2 NHS]|uniref:hypothetical protein n=1 Tax=Microbacterium sp. 179-I 3D2 NHS TaxID=3235178 RepID=UPI0039A13A0C